MCALSHKIIRCQDEKILEAEVLESKMLADTNQKNDIVKEVMINVYITAVVSRITLWYEIVMSE